MYRFLIERRKRNRLTLDMALILISLFWISRGRYLISFLLILVAMVGLYINRKKIVLVSDTGIRYPYLIDKNIEWADVENILLRDDILTIDLKNNKLLQSHIIANDVKTDETEFNTYCKKQLASHRAQLALNEKP